MANLNIQSTVRGKRLNPSTSPEQLFTTAYQEGETFVVSVAGKELAAIIPITLYESLRRLTRADFVDFATETRQSFASLSEQEQDALIDRAITFVRSPSPRHDYRD